MDKQHVFPRRVFLIAGIYGILVLLPMYFLEGQIGRDYPPPITHPEHFYGFIGLGLVWQFVFILISRDVVRYRPLMIAAVFEKLAFGVPSLILYAGDRIPISVAVMGSVDLVLGALFIAAFRATRAGEG